MCTYASVCTGGPVGKPPIAKLPGSSGPPSVGSMHDVPVGPSADQPGSAAGGSGSGAASQAAAPSSESALVLAAHVDMVTDAAPDAAAAMAGPSLVELQAQVTQVFCPDSCYS